jgi:hypothetical protein
MGRWEQDSSEDSVAESARHHDPGHHLLQQPDCQQAESARF